MGDINTISGKVLGQISIMQSVVTQLPDKISILKFVCQGFKDIPGVEKVEFRLYEEENCASEPLLEQVKSFYNSTIIHKEHKYAELFFKLLNQDVFSPYIPFIENFSNMISIIFEEKKQRQLNHTIVANLEKKVYERTRELEIEIGERKQTEEALRKSETYLRALIDTIPELVWLKDKNGAYLFCNYRFERFFGAEEKKIIGKTDYDFVDKDLADFFREHDKLAMAKGASSINEEEVTYADDGHHEFLETIKTPMYDSGGRLIGVLGIARDITERKQAEKEKKKMEEQLQQAQKMESIGTLAGGVAHDFNNMLSIILGNTEIILDDLDPANPVISNLHEIYKAAERSANLTRQLLAFARKQTISPKVLDLNEAIEGILKMIRRLIGENIDLAWLPKINLWAIKLDPSQVDQILANLCVNARDSIKDVGKITIETDNVCFDNDYCLEHNGFKPGDYVMTAISDNGCGMGKEILGNLFEPFFTTKGVGEGTGLGLATVYGIVKQNNGFINVYSEQNKGTTFRIYFPRCAENELPKQKSESRGADARGCETILLVEDEEAILRMTTMMLERLGYNVLSASNPTEAIKIGKSHPEKINLLMTDVVMPMMNGRDLAKKMFQLFPDLKYLFMSGYTANVIAHHGVLDYGMQFIQKPFSRQDLAKKVREVLDEEKGQVCD